jgi:putative membrane protein
MKDILNKKSFKILSVTLVVLIITGLVTGVVYASTKSSGDVKDDPISIKDTLKDAVKIEKNADTDGKEETVYVIGDPNGSIEKVIVSEWLKNPGRESTLKDYTELKDITNTNGNEKFNASGNNAYVWEAAGKDIHYQGAIDKELPVKVGVTYCLDGKEIKPEELAGKSGHVKLIFNYANTQKTAADIDGKKEDICVPFLMVSGVMLDTDKFTNVTVSNGQVVNDGSRDVVIGYALPGVSESLDIAKEDLDIPDHVEIEADTTDFSLPATLTVGMTGLFDNVKIDSKSSLEDLKDAMNDLEDAANDLIDGATEIYDGTAELYDKSQELKDGAKTLTDGAKDLSSGAAKANAGASELRDGLGTLSKNSASLNSGAKEIIDSVFQSATAQLREKLVSGGLMTEKQAADVTLTSANYTAVFKQLSGAVTVTPAQVEAQLRKKLSAMTADQQSLTLTIAYDLMAADSKLEYTEAVTQAAKLMTDAGTAQTACAAINPAWLADASHQALIGAVMGATGLDQTTAAKIAAIAIALDSSNPAGKIEAASAILKHAATVASTSASTEKITALCTAVANAATSTGNASLDAVKSKLDDVMKFYNGLTIYTGGVDSAYAGSKDLADGTSALKDGAKKLYNGAGSLYDGTKKLVSGVGDLKDGAKQLKDGLNEFYDEGVRKLSDAVNGDLTDLLDRLRAVADAGRSYRSFAGKPDNMNGSVKFIYRTDSVEKE